MTIAVPDMKPVLDRVDDFGKWLALFDASTVGPLTDSDRDMLARRLEQFMSDLADAFGDAGMDLPSDTWTALMAELDRLTT